MDEDQQQNGMPSQPIPIHYAFQWVRAEKGRRALPTVSHYMNRDQERFLHDRHALADKASYMRRLRNFTKGVKDVVGAFFRSNNPLLTAREIWDLCDRLARRRDGEYSCRGGNMPRLASFGDAFIGYSELNEEQKLAIIDELVDAIIARYGCAVEAVMHSKDGTTIDHFHLLMTDRIVDEEGVGAKIREMNGIFSQIAGDGVIEGDLRYAGHMEWQRICYAGLLRKYTGLDFRSESYVRLGLSIKPVKYVSKKRVYKEKRLKKEIWRIERQEDISERKAAIKLQPRPRPEVSGTEPARASDKNLVFEAENAGLAPLVGLRGTLLRQTRVRKGALPNVLRAHLRMGLRGFWRRDSSLRCGPQQAVAGWPISPGRPSVIRPTSRMRSGKGFARSCPSPRSADASPRLICARS